MVLSRRSTRNQSQGNGILSLASTDQIPVETTPKISRKTNAGAIIDTPPSKRRKISVFTLETKSNKSEDEGTPNHSYGTRQSKRQSVEKSTTISKQEREVSPSPVLSDTSDPLISSKFTVTPSKRPLRTPPTKSNVYSNGMTMPTGLTPTKSFKQRIEAVAKEKVDQDSVISKKSKLKPPTSSELEAIKVEILNKLTGRKTIPLIGKLSEISKYILIYAD